MNEHKRTGALTVAAGILIAVVVLVAIVITIGLLMGPQ